jgi:hypothetical protein
MGADESAPQDQLDRGVGASVRPGESNPIGIELAPGWVMGPNGPEPATSEVKSRTGSVKQPKR